MPLLLLMPTTKTTTATTETLTTTTTFDHHNYFRRHGINDIAAEESARQICLRLNDTLRCSAAIPSTATGIHSFSLSEPIKTKWQKNTGNDGKYAVQKNTLLNPEYTERKYENMNDIGHRKCFRKRNAAEKLCFLLLESRFRKPYMRSFPSSISPYIFPLYRSSSSSSGAASELCFHSRHREGRHPTNRQTNRETDRHIFSTLTC